MNLRHLIIFKTVCEAGNLTKASEKLYMTQPAVSKAIIDLESHLGTSLFDRINRRLSLNETGKLFLVKVIDLLELYNDLDKNIKEIEKNATLRIGSSITIASFILPSALKKLEEACNYLETKIIIDNAKIIEEKLLQNEIDLAFIEGVVKEDQLIKIPFSSYELVVICSPRHALASHPSITLNQLMEERLLLREKGSAIRDTFDSALLLGNKSVNPAWESVNSEVLIQAVKFNHGMSVLPREKVNKYIEDGSLVLVNVEDLQLSCMNHMVYHKGKYQTPAFRELVHIMKMNT